MKKALITGITGQDGSYLQELLLEKGYEVHGIVRRVALEDPHERLKRIWSNKDKLILHPGSVESYGCLTDILDRVHPDECYHLAAQSFVHESFEDSYSTFMINIDGTLNMLNAVKGRCPDCKFYFAGSSEMFGKVEETPQTENTKFHPRSPYGITKVAGFELTRNFREAYGLFACNGILFNHESPRRGAEFVTRKITRGLARIKNGTENVMTLGNLDARRDWGYSKDFVEAMWSMLQQDKPNDYVIATGETHSIKEFIEEAFRIAHLPYEILDLHNLSSKDADMEVKRLQMLKDKNFVVQHPNFYRPAEVDLLIGDPSKAKVGLGWVPKTSFKELVALMVNSDCK